MDLPMSGPVRAKYQVQERQNQMRAIYTRIGTLLTLICCCGSAWTADVESEPFLVKFDSHLTSTGEDLNVSSRVSASFLISQMEGELGRFRGVGRLHYTALSGLPNATTTDGVLFINDMQVSSNDGTVVVKLFPGNPGPNEWIVFPQGPPTQFFHWFGVFIGFHLDETGVGGVTVENWEYPDGEVYARKSYNGSLDNDGVHHTEATTIELIPIPDPPRIDKINIESKGTSVMDPETEKKWNCLQISICHFCIKLSVAPGRATTLPAPALVILKTIAVGHIHPKKVRGQDVIHMVQRISLLR